MGEREIGKLQAEVQNVHEDVVYLRDGIDALRKDMSNMNDKLDRRFVTRLEVRAINSMLTIAVIVITIVEFMRGKP